MSDPDKSILISNKIKKEQKGIKGAWLSVETKRCKKRDVNNCVCLI